MPTQCSAAEIRTCAGHQELTARARKEADDLIASARAQIQEERSKAVAELRGQVADMAIEAARRLIPQAIDEKTHRSLVEEYVKQIGS